MIGSVTAMLVQAAHDLDLANRTALESGTAQWSYRDFASRAGRVAGALWARGLRRGNRVALLGARTVDTVAGIFGVMAALLARRDGKPS